MSARIRFLPSGRVVHVTPGSTLLEAVRRADLPVASACGADGLCGRCGLRVHGAGQGLSAEHPAETRAKRRNRIDPRLRLACRARVRGDMEVSAPYW